MVVAYFCLRYSRPDVVQSLFSDVPRLTKLMAVASL
jgi:hypothetical protein